MRAATVLAGAISFLFSIGCLTVPAAPVADGTLFQDDFSSGDLSQWTVGLTDATNPPNAVAEYDGTQGSPAGSFHIFTGTQDEGFGRPIMADATTEPEWVTEFDFRLNSTDDSNAGSNFILYAAYGAGGFTAIDIELGLPAGVEFNSSPWDLNVFDSAGGHGIDANLAWDTWHHFTIHRVFATGVVDLYVNDSLLGTYSSPNAGLKLGNAQIGDVTGSAMFGNANWDNFSIGGVIPEPGALSLLLFAGLLLRGLNSRWR